MRREGKIINENFFLYARSHKFNENNWRVARKSFLPLSDICGDYEHDIFMTLMKVIGTCCDFMWQTQRLMGSVRAVAES